MQSGGFEPPRVSTIELESIALDRSAMIAINFLLFFDFNTNKELISLKNF